MIMMWERIPAGFWLKNHMLPSWDKKWIYASSSSYFFFLSNLFVSSLTCFSIYLLKRPVLLPVWIYFRPYFISSLPSPPIE